MPKVLFRADDYAECRDHDMWDRVLGVFSSFEIGVCVGVIPSNRDAKLLRYKGESCQRFWDNVRSLEGAGHTIAVHGYQHRYHLISPSRSLIPVNSQSEFVGLDVAEQKDKLAKSVSIFRQQGLHPKVFMAPSHTFDNVTIECLKQVGIGYITDGYFFRPVKMNQIKFIPQQFGSFYPPMLPVQTICLHPNTMSEADVDRLFVYCQRYRAYISDFSEFEHFEYQQVTALDELFKRLLYLRFKR